MAKTLLTIKFAGDSGDGIQLSGNRLAMIQALFGCEVATYADYPADIRAPRGTLYGVSAYRIQVGSGAVYTPGDSLDILVTLSVAAYQVWHHKLKPGGILLADSDAFTDKELDSFGLSVSPLINPKYRVIALPISSQLTSLFASEEYKKKDILQSKNFFTLGAVCWLLERDISQTKAWIQHSSQFSAKMKHINTLALSEGYTASLVRQLIPFHITLHGRCIDQNKDHRFLNGGSALALGLVAAARRSQKTLFYASYPITPASSLLHTMAAYHEPDVMVHQAEDEIAAIGSAIGAAYGGCLGVTGTSGPGFALMSEFMGLAVMAEVPLVVIDVQRAGPSTGMPTKTSQGDLYLALYGRHDVAEVVVLAVHSPCDGLDKAYLAAKIAMERNCVVIVLSDAFLASSHQVWRIKDPGSFPAINIPPIPSLDGFQPYQRDPRTFSRPWIPPGTPGYEHTIGGLEKTRGGDISYDGQNHAIMMKQRHQKIIACVDLLPPLIVEGDIEAPTLIISWGSTYGALKQFVLSHRLSCQPSHRLAYVHLEALFPLQKELGDYLEDRKNIVVIESNNGQATTVLRDQFPLVSFISITKCDGKPWNQLELKQRIQSVLEPSNKAPDS